MASAGLVLLVGLKVTDQSQDMDLIIRKVLGTRIFHDQEDGRRFTRSVTDEGAEILCVSQVSARSSRALHN
jgi:D-aminoacyl-tRNA deacylase